MIVLMFSWSLLQVPEPSVRLLAGRRIPGDHGVAGLRGPFVAGLARQAGRCASGANLAPSDAVVDMLAAALADELTAGAAVSNGPRHALLLRWIKSWIEDELTDRDSGRRRRRGRCDGGDGRCEAVHARRWVGSTSM